MSRQYLTHTGSLVFMPSPSLALSLSSLFLFLLPIQVVSLSTATNWALLSALPAPLDLCLPVRHPQIIIYFSRSMPTAENWDRRDHNKGMTMVRRTQPQRFPRRVESTRLCGRHLSRYIRQHV